MRAVEVLSPERDAALSCAPSILDCVLAGEHCCYGREGLPVLLAAMIISRSSFLPQDSPLSEGAKELSMAAGAEIV